MGKFASQMLRYLDHATQKDLVYLGFQYLMTHTILRIWPRRTTTCSLDWKTIENSPFLVRRGSHCSRGDQVGLTNFLIFLWMAFKS